MSRRFIVPLFLAGLMAAPAFAQQQPSTGGGNQNNGDRGNRSDRGGNGGNRGNFDPAAMRQRFSDMIKEQMGASDDEWKVIQPKLDKVMTAQRDARGGGMGGMFRRRDNGGDSQSSDRQRSAVEQAQTDLRTLLDNKDSTADQISAKLTTLREAREKAKTDLVSAQKELKEVLSQRQEAVLVMMGMLD